MSPASPSAVPLWRDVRVYRIGGQIVFVLIIILIGWWFQQNMARGLARIGNNLSFDFLRGNAGFALADTPIPYTPEDSYAYAFLIGVINTLRVAVVGIVLATLIGLIVGVARLSTNWLVAKLAQLYVEVLRNTPLLIQLSFWYFAGVLRLPRVRESIELPGSIFLSNRGLTIPWFNPTETFGTWLLYTLAGLLIAIGVYILLGLFKHPLSPPRGFWAVLMVLLTAGASALSLNPINPSTPVIQGFNFAGGLTLSPEYAALLFGLVVYTSAFIGEIVRAGIQAVPRGLNEASRALGLSYAQTLRLVTIPLALRVIIPPLTNQYLNLTKNSSLAVWIGYADLFYVSNTIFNQSGQTVQIIVLIMATYLLMSLTISLLMNLLNARFKLVER